MLAAAPDSEADECRWMLLVHHTEDQIKQVASCRQSDIDMEARRSCSHLISFNWLMGRCSRHTSLCVFKSLAHHVTEEQERGRYTHSEMLVSPFTGAILL